MVKNRENYELIKIKKPHLSYRAMSFNNDSCASLFVAHRIEPLQKFNKCGGSGVSITVMPRFRNSAITRVAALFAITVLSNSSITR